MMRSAAAAACRSLLNRRRAGGALLLSQKLPSRRHATDSNKKRHLYLVLDDIRRGCSVHKLDISDAAAAESPPGRRLPGPPVARMHSPTLGEYPRAAVLGSNIIGFGSGGPASSSGGVTVAFDITTAELTVLRDLPAAFRDHYHIHLLAAAGKNWLFMIESGSPRYMDERRGSGGAMHFLELGTNDGEDSTTPRLCWSDGGLPTPFDGEDITAHAVHPAALFVSVHSWWHRYVATFFFSYDGGWTRHGDWKLPFAGEGHYDADLGAWVGLHLDLHLRDDEFYMDGHLCCCDVPVLDDVDDTAAPGWKLCMEELFTVDPKRHVDAKLVPTGGGGRFCLVEIMAREGVDVKECLGDGDKCVVRLTMFRARYGDDGELTITDRRPAAAGEYKVSRYTDMFQVQAFWM